MDGLVKVKSSNFGTITCDYYSNGQGEFFMTRKQIGQALEYADAQKAIDNLHSSHKERLNKFSVTLKSRGTDGKLYDTCFYSARGVYEICRWSHQAKADDFYDHVYDILEGLRLGYLKLSTEHSSLHWQQTRKESKLNRLQETDEIKRFIEYATKQGSRTPDRYYTNFSLLADKAAGIKPKQRDNATVSQINNLILAENIINQVIKIGIKQGWYYKDIYKACKGRIEEFREIAYLNVQIKENALT